MALRAAGQQVVIDGHPLTLTNLDRVMYPETGTTKADVLDYYARVADLLLPHCRDRPVTRKRWVHGVGTLAEPGATFFQKNLDDRSTPRWVARREIEHSRQRTSYPLVDNLATLTWLAQNAALELHVPQWQFGQTGAPRNPDRMVLDLDPGPGVGLRECAAVARWARVILEGMGLAPLPVTSGSKGIHLYCALDRTQSSSAISEVAHELARVLEADHPDLVVSDMRKDLRAGRVLVDWSQNSASKTTITPYSLRGRPSPTVAAPREWSELDDDRTLHQLDYRAVLTRVTEGIDPLRGLVAHYDDRQTAPAHEADSDPWLIHLMKDAAAQPLAQNTLPPLPTPMLATAGSAALRVSAANTSRWAYEMKWDGIRAIAAVHDGVLTLTSRNGTDITDRYPELSVLASPGTNLVLDGEIVAISATGQPDFSLLQQRIGLTARGDIERTALRVPVHFMVFDILEREGRSLLQNPWEERRRILEATVHPVGPIQLPPVLTVDLDDAMITSRELGLEGVIAKRRDAVYSSGRRSPTWVKFKHHLTQEVVIGGFTVGAGSRANMVGALLVGIPAAGGLRYVGRVGTGFSERALRDIRDTLTALVSEANPFTSLTRAEGAGARFVEPSLVGEVEFAEWTSASRLRQPSWRGWRLDKAPADVRWESSPAVNPQTPQSEPL